MTTERDRQRRQRRNVYPITLSRCKPVTRKRCCLRMLKLTQATTVTVLLLSLAWATPAKAQWPDPNVYYKIHWTPPRPGWGCLDIQGRRKNWAETNRCADVSGQYWRFTPVGNGFFHITSLARGTTLARGRGMCLGLMAPSNNVGVTPCANSSGQLWRIAGGSFASRLRDPKSVRLTAGSAGSAGSGDCLRVDHKGWAYQAQCSPNDWQTWYLRRTNLEVNWLTRR